MKFRSTTHILAALLISAVSASAQDVGSQNPCLLSKAEFNELAGGSPFSDADVIGATTCAYENGVIHVYSGKTSQAQWNTHMKNPVMANAKKVPVAGVGDSAYAFFVNPQKPDQIGAAFVVFNKGEHTVAVSINPPAGESAETVRDQAIAAAKLAAARLE